MGEVRIQDHGEDGQYLDGAVADLTIMGDQGAWDVLAWVMEREDLPRLYEALKTLKRKGAF